MVDNATATPDPLDQLDNPEPDTAAPANERELPIDQDPRAELGALAKAAEPAEPAPQEPAQEPAQPAPQEQPPAQPELPPAAQQGEPAPQPGQTTVPLPSLLDEREKRQAAEQRAQQLETQMQGVSRQLQEMQQQQQQAPVDPVTDPQGFVESMNNAMRQQHLQTQQMLENERLNQSEYMTRQGPDAAIVDEAFQAFNAARTRNPALSEMVMRSPHPWQEMVNWHKREQVHAQLGDGGLDAYAKRIEAETLAKFGLTPPQTPPAGQPTTPPAQTPSAPLQGASSNQQPAQQPAPAAAPTAPRIPQSLAGAPGGLNTPQEAFNPEADPLNDLE